MVNSLINNGQNNLSLRYTENLIKILRQSGNFWSSQRSLEQAFIGVEKITEAAFEGLLLTTKG